MFKGHVLAYDSFGCIKVLNALIKAHNSAMNEKVVALRKAYPHVLIIYADGYAMYKNILKDSKSYNVMAPLMACYGMDGDYNFNIAVTCRHVGLLGRKFVNSMDDALLKPCSDELAVLNWDGVHTLNTFNKAAATAFLLGKRVTAG